MSNLLINEIQTIKIKSSYECHGQKINPNFESKRMHLTLKMLALLSDHPGGPPVASREMRMRQGTERYLWKSDVPGSPYNRSGGVEVRVEFLDSHHVHYLESSVCTSFHFVVLTCFITYVCVILIS